MTAKLKKKPVKKAIANKNQTIAVQPDIKKVSREAFLSAIHVFAGFDIINYGRLQKSTYQKASVLAKELEQAYEDYC